MILTEFKAEHLVMLKMQDTLDTRLIDKETILEEGRKREGDAYTLVNNGSIIGCGGVTHRWGGVYDAWAIPSIHAPSNKRSIVVKSQEGIKRILENSKIKRINALVLAGYEAGINFAEYLGFRCDGELKQYGENGEDYKMFSIVR